MITDIDALRRMVALSEIRIDLLNKRNQEAENIRRAERTRDDLDADLDIVTAAIENIGAGRPEVGATGAQKDKCQQRIKLLEDRAARAKQRHEFVPAA